MNLSPLSIRPSQPSPSRRRPRCGKPSLGRCLLLFWALAVNALLWSPPFLGVSLGDASPPVSQEQLKAVYLYNFLQFVTWPSGLSRADQSSAKVIGLLGNSTISTRLEELSANLAKRNQAPVQIKSYGNYVDGMDLSTCHILFISASERRNFNKIMTSLKHAPVLTVGDSNAFLAAGGMITLHEEQNRLRYQINRKETTAAGLRLSSQLLKAAITVTDE